MARGLGAPEIKCYKPREVIVMVGEWVICDGSIKINSLQLHVKEQSSDIPLKYVI